MNYICHDNRNWEQKAITITRTSVVDPSLEAPSPIANGSTPTTNAPPLRKRKRAREETTNTRKTGYEGSSAPMEKVLEGIQQLTDSRRPVLHVALELLEREYKGRLTEEHMDVVYDFLEDEAKAVFFTGIKDKEGRDRWLQRKAGVEVMVSDWELSD